MKWSKRELAGLENGSLKFSEDLQFCPSDLEAYPRIRKVLEAHCEGKGTYEPEEEKLYLKLKISGTVVVPCDITLDDVDVDVESEDEVVISFNPESYPDAVIAENNVIDTLPVVLQLIYMDLPTKVVKPGITEYPSGDGWEVVTEEQYEKSRGKGIDPRLAKLLEYKPEN